MSNHLFPLQIDSLPGSHPSQAVSINSDRKKQQLIVSKRLLRGVAKQRIEQWTSKYRVVVLSLSVIRYTKKKKQRVVPKSYICVILL